MKYEISDLLNEDNKNGLTMLRMHKKADKGVLSHLILILIVCHNIIIHILFIIISSIGLIILCNDFIPEYNSHIYLSDWLRHLTPFSIALRLKISNLAYIIICVIIYVICILRLTDIFHLIYQIKHVHITEVYNIRVKFIFRIMNHIGYILFSYIVEFLSFIYYIEFLPNDFIIKKDTKIDNIIHWIILFFNSIFIIVYNINNFFCISLANRPMAGKTYPFKMKVTKSKLLILISLQNIGVLHPLQYYLNKSASRIWCIVYIAIFFLILLWIYFISFRKYNYDNVLNSVLSFIGSFCFVSIVIEMILFFFSIKYQHPKEILLYSIVKIIASICLFICLKKIYQTIMMKILKKRLFYNNPYNYPFDNNMITSILFLRELFETKNMKCLCILQGYIIEHQKQCINYNCACKLLIIKNSTNNNEQFIFVDDLNKKLNYYIESILIKYNFHNNFELAILLSEHFYLYKNNPIMSYSILQTLLHYDYINLNKSELICIYELMNKYIIHVLVDKTKKIDIAKCYGKTEYLSRSIKEIESKQFFSLIIKIKKIIKYMIFYSTKFISIIKHKNNYEYSTNIIMDDIYNEIKHIHSPYLNKKILNELICYSSLETIYTKDIEKYLYDLEVFNKNISYEFLYKIFLFADYYWEGKIPDKLLSIFYSFTSHSNLYSNEINPEIYKLLEKRYFELFDEMNSKYYLLFKYTKGAKIIYISESLTKKLHYKQKDLINNNLGVLLIKDLVEPHNNIIKQFLILQQNNILNDRYKFIFDSEEYMINSRINSTLQIGINKNILTISIIEINKNNNELNFFLNKSLNIISINQNFSKSLSLSLPLIKEFKIELSDLFGLKINDIAYYYKKEIKEIRNIREYIILDTKQYILKNLFNNQKLNTNYHIINKYIIKDDNNDSDKDEEDSALKEKENNNVFILKTFHNLFDNNKSQKSVNLRPIYYQVNKDNFLCNLRKIFEKINSYEQDKLEKKNIYNDYLRLGTKYSEFDKSKINFNIKIEPKLIFDTVFFSGKVDLFIYENILEINNNYKSFELKNTKTETEDVSSLYNRCNTIEQKGKFKRNRKKIPSVKFKGDDKSNNDDDHKIKNITIINNYADYIRNKIKINKISKTSLCSVLLLCIIVLLVTCIIILDYQTSLINKHDKIYDALYYNYYQRTQFNYLYSIILSIFFKLTNISSPSHFEDNKEILHFIGKNIEKSHQLFFNYYMDFKLELKEDFTQLYEPLESNKITVNWENILFYNDYNTELALIIYRILDCNKHEFDKKDIDDCNNLLLHKYLSINRRGTPINGNFIKLVYYLYLNFYTSIKQFFYYLEDSFDQSLKNFSRKTATVYIILEVIALITFLFFFGTNLIFLMKSNKYIFQNILFIFVDFTQNKDYSFNNKYYNLLAIKKISNYILLLKDFCPNNLDSLKYDQDIDNISIMTNINMRSFIEDDEKEETNNSKKQKNGKKNKKKFVSKKSKLNNCINPDGSKNLILSNKQCQNILINSNINNSNKNNQKILDEGIHTLNNKDLNNISNLSINNVNNSTNLILNSINMNSSIVTNSQNNNSKITSLNDRENKKEYKNEKEKEKENIYDDLIVNKSLSDNITIEKIMFKTQYTMLNSIKILIIIFIIFTLFFIIYYIYKLTISILFISNFHNMINDFKDLSLQYNNIVRYWVHIKQLFILPNSTIYYDFDQIEEYFAEINSKVNYIYKNRIKEYERISYLYDYLMDTSLEKNISSIDFCSGHKRCNDIKNSNKFLLSNGIESFINLYAKEISNYYKDFNKLKDSIKDKHNIVDNFMNDKYLILSSNANHIIYYVQELFFSYFYNDEKDIVNAFYLKIKLLNIIEVCYCALLNLFSILFVCNFLTKMIYSLEEASKRINKSIRRMKLIKIEGNNDN